MSAVRPAGEHEEQPDAKKARTEGDKPAAADSSKVKYGLYSYWRSGASYRVRIALAHKGIPYKYHAISLLKGEQASGEYAKLNPQHKVPLLVWEENGQARSLAQSIAIIDYLETAHPDKPSLLPKDPYLRAKAYALAESLNADTQPLQNLWVLKKIEEIAKDGAKAKDEWARFVVAKGLASFEADVQSTAGTRCVGDELTIADLFLVPQLGTARRFGVDMAVFPTLLRIEAELLQLPAFKAAHPDQQPDKA